jgi:hypothetical protein
MNKQKEIEQKEKKAGEIPDGYEEQVDASFIKFEEIGDSLHGKILDIGFSKRYGFKLYTIRADNNETLRFHGTTQLDQLMSNASVGDFVYIEYIDEQETPAGSMKIFSVGIKREKKR